MGDNKEVTAPTRLLERALAELAPNARVLLIAVSGGADSVALLRLLTELSEGGGYLEVAHFDHALRPDSADDAAFVAQLAERFEVPFHTERAEVARVAKVRGWNVEDAARRLRYSFLTRTAKRIRAEIILTAHTRDDQAETVLMQLLRGAAHLQGMPARRGRVVRPLLGVPRSALRDYLSETGQTFLEDPSNADTSRTRAWARHVLLPLLETRYPQVRAGLARHAALQRDQAAHFSTLAEGLLEPGVESAALGVSVAQLLTRDAATQRAALAALLRRAAVPPDGEHIETLRRALASPLPTRVSLPRGLRARVAYGRLELLASPPRAEPDGRLEDRGLENSSLDNSGLKNRGFEALPGEVDAKKLEAFPNVRLRTRRPGDRIRLSGGSKKLSDLLIDRKVPREARNSLRVLASGSEVLWLEEVATDVRVAKVTDSATDPLAKTDVRWMRLALEQAQRAAERGELPVGAVVVRGGEVLGAGHNITEADRDPTAHAELHALRAAALALGDWRLSGCTLFVTLEPCVMCFGAMLSAHLPCVVYGATNLREGALGGVSKLQDHPWKRGLEVRGGVLAGEAAGLLTRFFAARRRE